MSSYRTALYPDHVSSRQRHAHEAMAKLGYDSLLIHSGRPRLHFLDDRQAVFRANPHFVSWLPLPRHADCVLLLRPGRQPVLWYYQPDDFWHLPPADPAPWWADHYDVRVISGPDDWRRDLGDVGSLAVIGDAPGLDELRPGADVNPVGLLQRLDEARTVKTEWEQHLMVRANRRAVAGHRAARDAFLAGASELAIHFAYLRAVRQPELELPYDSIVALNEHAAVLHYQFQDAQPPGEHRSFLLDAGADEAGYAADITRTWAARPGEFAELVEAVDGIQQHLASSVRPDTDYVELHREAHRGIAALLAQCGLVRMAPDAIIESGISSRFYPHGLGHFIGVQVHDVAGKVDAAGNALPPPPAHPYLRLTRTLQAGQVLTIEPGLYFIPSLLAPLRSGEFRRHIDWERVNALVPWGGIRVEDDVLVTAGGARNLTREAFAWLDSASVD